MREKRIRGWGEKTKYPPRTFSTHYTKWIAGNGERAATPVIGGKVVRG